jgi:hypothetical protein
MLAAAAAAAAAEILLRMWLQLGLGLPTGNGPNNPKHKMTPATYKLKAAFSIVQQPLTEAGKSTLLKACRYLGSKLRAGELEKDLYKRLDLRELPWQLVMVGHQTRISSCIKPSNPLLVGLRVDTPEQYQLCKVVLTVTHDVQTQPVILLGAQPQLLVIDPLQHADTHERMRLTVKAPASWGHILPCLEASRIREMQETAGVRPGRQLMCCREV